MRHRSVGIAPPAVWLPALMGSIVDQFTGDGQAAGGGGSAVHVKMHTYTANIIMHTQIAIHVHQCVYL